MRSLVAGFGGMAEGESEVKVPYGRAEQQSPSNDREQSGEDGPDDPYLSDDFGRSRQLGIEGNDASHRDRAKIEIQAGNTLWQVIQFEIRLTMP